MNRIVREHYPVSKLPDDLRGGVETDGMARVIVEPSKLPAIQGDWLTQLRAAQRAHFGSVSDVVAYVRSLRDE